jgi:hypothetical protein
MKAVGSIGSAVNQGRYCGNEIDLSKGGAVEASRRL